MWIRLSLSRNHRPLAALVGRDRNLYWRLIDLGYLLQRSNPSSFQKRFSADVIRGRDVLVPGQYPRSTSNAKLVRTQRAKDILSMYDVDLKTTWSRQFSKALINGFAKLHSSASTASVHHSTVLQVVKTRQYKSGSTVRIPTFLNSFIKEVLLMAYKTRLFAELRKTRRGRQQAVEMPIQSFQDLSLQDLLRLRSQLEDTRPMPPVPLPRNAAQTHSNGQVMRLTWQGTASTLPSTIALSHENGQAMYVLGN